jgi:uncharacterized protein with NRDE domain
MYLIATAWNAHPRYPLILLGNRDELHRRPSVAADWWPEAPGVFGGRDLKAGGSWHCIERRFGPGGVPAGESPGRHSG